MIYVLHQTWELVAVAIRREMEAHAAGLLGEREIYALPDWTPVQIVWFGGNGPHRYDVVQFGGRPHAAVERGNPHRDPDTDADLAAGRLPRGMSDALIDCVGADRWTTWVRLPSDAPWPPRPWARRG